MKMRGLLIRKIKKEELSDALAILRYWNMEPREASVENPNPERISLILKHTLIAIYEEKIIGVCSYLILSEDTAETASLAVDPEYKGKGVGSALQKARLQELIERGFSWVHTEADRPETIKWYISKYGYTKIGKSPKKHSFSLDGVDFWTVMKLDLKRYASIISRENQ